MKTYELAFGCVGFVSLIKWKASFELGIKVVPRAIRPYWMSCFF